MIFLRRFLALTLVSAIVLCASWVGAYAASFPDMPQGHWAYDAVMRLAEEGTVNGMTDGTFNPTGTVSRAEFVKMLGKAPNLAPQTFDDITKDHWAYEYIIVSGLDGDDNGNFNPSNVITRGEVANLLYKRFANEAKEIAPYYIASQGTNSDATAWVYNHGLMVGADMLNLRMDDGLTRAEAAVLIVRAKDIQKGTSKSFIDNFTDDTYKSIYEGSNLFDSAYNAEEGITYEELSAVAIRNQYKDRDPAIQYNFEAKYDHRYARFWDVMCRGPLDEKNFDSSYASSQKLATVEDAIAMITYCIRNNSYISSNMVEPTGVTYSEVSVKDFSSGFGENMSYAYNFGISLYADGKINPKKLITKKELSCILMQYGLTFGDHIVVHCGYDGSYIPSLVRKDSSSYPKNASYFAYILEDVPNHVYETPFKEGLDVVKTPKEFEDFASRHKLMLYRPLLYIASDAYDKGADIYLDYYPSLVLTLNNSGEVCRVKLSVNKAFSGMKLSDIFTLENGVEDLVLNEGDVLWCDLATNAARISTYIDYELYTLQKIIK